MSAVIYHEPYKIPSGMLALAVHAAFFALLYFGFTWQTLPSPTMSVELWRDLPEVAAPTPASEELPPPPPPPPAARMDAVVKPVQPAAPEVIVPDIVLPEKKKPDPKPDTRIAERKAAREKAEREKVAQEKKAAQEKIAREKAAQEKAEQEKAAMENAAREKAAQEKAAQEQALRDQAARERAEKEAAIGKVVDEYGAKIKAKIKRNIVMPSRVPDDARAEFSVTLLPGGSVLQARLVKSSGNELYDRAVERAILKSDPLPLPPDVALFNKFRNLNLMFQPKEQ